MQMRTYKHPAEETIDAMIELHLQQRLGLLDPFKPTSSAEDLLGTATGIVLVKGSGSPSSE